MPSRFNFIFNLPKELLIALITGLRPILGPAICKFPVTCTKYAIIQLQEKPLHKAIGAIIKRLIACSPFG